MFEVSERYIDMKSLNSVKECGLKQTNINIGKIEYKPPKKIGETDIERTPILNKFSGLELVEDQILNVFGYIEALWKSSNFVQVQEETPISIITQNEFEDQPQKNESSIIIVKDLAGIDLEAKDVLNKIISPKKVKIVPASKSEVVKIDPNELKRKKIIENLTKRIPNIEFLLSKTVMNEDN